MSGRARNWPGIVALALGGLLGWTAAATAEPAADSYDLFFLGGGDPILIRLHVQIGDRPLSAAWLDSVAKLHAFLDVDGDGVLRREEAERVQWAKLRRFFGGSNPVALPNPPGGMAKANPPPALPALDSRPADGVVSVAELSEFLRALRAPFSIESQAPMDSERDTTFGRIDANGDGALSGDELAQAASVLSRFDQNDDGTISTAEMTTFRNPIFGGMGRGQWRAVPEPPVLLIDPHVSRVRMVHQILNRLDTVGPSGEKAKDHRLGRGEIGLGPDVFKQFDDDGDGTLDSDELMQYLDRSVPALELIVRLGPQSLKRNLLESLNNVLVANGKPGLGAFLSFHDIEVVESKRPPAGDAPRVRISRTSAGALTLELGDVWVDVHTEDAGATAVQARQIIESQFERLDTDKDKALTLAEVKGREPFQSLFELMDRNGDGRVPLAEQRAAIDVIEWLARGQSMLAVADRGVLLFGNLDTSGDGRLGVRELRAAAQRLASFDRNGDGQLTTAEIPHRFEWSLSQARMSLGFNFGRSNRSVRPMGETPRTGDGPAWFRSMDRNRDGDLSTREFLGPLGAFQKLDADGDGLVDAREAKNARTP